MSGLGSRWGQARAVTRLARRTARREWRRTALVAALVMVPVLVGVVVAGLVRANDVTPAERVTAELGAADLGVELHPGGSEPLTVEDPDVRTMARLIDDVEAARSLSYRTTRWYQTGVALLDGARVIDLPLDDPLADGMYQVLAGRAPQAVDELALSEELLEHHGLSLGDTLALDGAGELTVVGAFVEPTNVRSRVAVVAPTALDRLLDGYEIDAVPQWLLGGLTDSPAVEQQLLAAYDQATGLSEAQERVHGETQQAGGSEVAATPVSETLPAQPYLVSRANLLRNSELGQTGLERVMTPQVIATLVAAVLLAEVALIAGAAYATGARRRLRELGLLGANGATTAHVRGAVVGEATVTGIVGALAGVTAGVAALGLGRRLMQRFITPLITRLELSTTDLLGPAVVAVLAVTLAAWLPARTAARVPTTTALEGRMPLSAPKRWIVPVGVGLAGFGALLLLAGILAAGSVGGVVAAMGVLLAIAGTALLTVPMIAGIGRVADRFPATLRLVLRDSGRQRTRAAAASASAMVVLIAPVLIATISLSIQNKDLVHGLPAADNHVLLPAHEQRMVGTDPATVDLERIAADRDASLAAIAAVFPDAARADVPILDERASVAPDPRFTTSRPPQEHQQPTVAGELGPDQQRSSEEAFWYGWNQDDTHVAEATHDLLAALGDPAITRAVDDGHTVVLGLEPRDTTVTIAGQQRPAVEVPARVLRYGFPRVLVPPASTAELSLAVVGTAELFVTSQPITGAQRDTLYQTVNTGNLHVGTVGLGNGPGLRWAAVAATLLVALVILALVTMLSATESDHDLRTMVAVGAPPRMRRRFLGLQSAVHALVGAVLAVPLAIALAWATSRAEADIVTRGLFGAISARAMGLDWPTLAAVLLGVPLIIGLAIALLVRSAATVPPRRAG